VTHTKRIYRNLLRKETSFVYYTSSVLIQIESGTISLVSKIQETSLKHRSLTFFLVY